MYPYFSELGNDKQSEEKIEKENNKQPTFILEVQAKRGENENKKEARNNHKALPDLGKFDLEESISNEKPENYEKPDNYKTAKKLEKPENYENPKKLEKPENNGKPENFEKSGNNGKPEKLEKPLINKKLPTRFKRMKAKSGKRKTDRRRRTRRKMWVVYGI